MGRADRLTEQRKNWSYEELWEIAMAYGESLETSPQLSSLIGSISRESMLPYSKQTIKHALATLLLIEQDNSAISLLGGAYTYLDVFVSDEVYQFVSSKLAIKSTGIEPSKDEMDNLRESLINLSEEEHELWTKYLAEKNSERKRLYRELKILLEIIGDPNDFTRTLEQVGD
jgi:hypothetical protein